MHHPVFILSTGRTGTQFFEDYINQTTKDALCKHEPRPSRRFKFLSNLYLNHKVSHPFIIKTYLRSRRRVINKTGDRVYIESSNFIFGCIPSLNEWYDGIKIIHIVRHPVDYVKSHLSHGFWRGHKKFFAKYVPYWLEKIEVEDRSNPIELLSTRWNYVNGQINSYTETNKYLRVRFEDIFSADMQQSSAQLNQIREFCGLSPLEEAENRQWLKRPKNYSRRKQALESDEVDYILKNTHSLMKDYRYHD
ncbi:MAG: sulfotransferase [Bacteroidota bacterium]